MRVCVLYLLLFAFVVLGASSTEAATVLEKLFKCGHEDPCVIRDNLGGSPRFYKRAAKEALKKGTRFVVDGTCASSCVIFASRVRKNLCITKKARMEIHYGVLVEGFGDDSGTSTVEGFRRFVTRVSSFVPDYGKDITSWALKNHKLPDGAKVYTMTHTEALQFWKPCTYARRFV